MPRFRPAVEAMASYVPGRGARHVGATPADIVKLSANEWSGPPISGVVDAVSEAARHLNRYPDDGDELRHQIASIHGCDPDGVLLGPGSNTLLYWTALAAAGPGDEVVYPDPSFALYRLTAALTGATGVAVLLDADLRLDLAAMAHACGPSTRLVFVCNPNNPTSTAIDGASLARFVEQLDADTVIAVDEAYGEFGVAPHFSSVVPLVDRHDNVVVYRTLSKIYGLAGARFGYAIGHPETVAVIAKAGVPFAASRPATAAATVALSATEAVRSRRDHAVAERERMTSRLRESGYEVADSQTNFVYVAVRDGTDRRLEERGVVVRTYEAGWIRVTIGTVEENDAFLSAMERIRLARPS